MIYSKKYSLSVEKRVYLYPLMPSISVKIDDKSGFLHVINEFVARNIYHRAGCTASCGGPDHSMSRFFKRHAASLPVAHLFTFGRTKCCFYSLLVALLFTFGRALIHFWSHKVLLLFTFGRKAILQHIVIQSVTITFKAYINFSKVSNKILDNFSKVIETSFDCSWSIDSFRLPGLRLHSSRGSYQLNDNCIYD